jgi:ferrochelatase
MAVGSPTGSPSEIGERWRREQAAAANDASPVGVLLLSVGAPASADDVEEYLYNVFCDPEILTLPPALMWALKRPVAWVIAKTRAPAARAAMLEASPNTTQVIQAMANQLGSVLGEQDVKSKVYIAMRYWHPFAEEAVEQMKADGIDKLVIVPLYPQFSISTSGSALRVLESMLYSTPGFPLKSSVVPSWFNRPGYLRSTAQRIADAVASLPEAIREDAHILYSAQGLPRAYVENMGDPYEEQVECTRKLLRVELDRLGVSNGCSLAYQGRFGPPRVPWLSPTTSDEIQTLAERGTAALVMVPISFVYEHMGTVNEMDREYAALAAAAGIRSFVRVPTLSTDPAFIETLASIVTEAIPDLSRPSMQQINEGNPVSLNMVNEYTDLYTKDKLQLVPQERPWGFTEQAEIINGRIAMAAVTTAVALSVDPTLKAMVAVSKAASNVIADIAE